MVATLSSFLETDSDDFVEEILFKKRNMLKMTVFVLCHFVYCFEKDVFRNVMSKNTGKGRKKRLSFEGENSEWPEFRIKFLVVIKKIFKLPIEKLWTPPSIDREFINFVAMTFFKLLENVDVAKDKGSKTEVFRFLGNVLSEQQTGLVYSVKIVQLVQDFEHLSTILAEAVSYFVKECSADTLISECFRESTLVDADILCQNLNAAHSLAQFLISITEDNAKYVLPLGSYILQFLEWESHVMRNCALSIMGILLNKVLCSESLSDRDKKIRIEFLGHLEAHLLDGNSFVRSRVIQVLKMLMEEKALASVELQEVGNLISKRLCDKASNARKNAMSFMAEFVQINQFACQIPLPVLRESYENETKKLKEMRKCTPVIFDDSDDELKETDENMAVVFDDSDDELPENAKDAETNAASNGNENDEIQDVPMDVQVESTENLNENNSENDINNVNGEIRPILQTDEDAVQSLKKQQDVVDFLKNTLTFSEVIHSIIQPIYTLLHSSTQTDILEAIEFMTVIIGSTIQATDLAIMDFLKLVYSKELVVKETIISAFKSLYLSDGQNKNSTDVADNLIKLLKEATMEDALTVQEFVKHFYKTNEIPNTVPKTMWSTFTNPNCSVKEKISILVLFRMFAEIQPEVILQRLHDFINCTLSQESGCNFLLNMHALKALGKINDSSRNKPSVASFSDVETKLPQDHVLVFHIKHLLVNGIKNFDDDQWVPMADEAVSVIFSLVEEPIVVCSDISRMLADILCQELQSSNSDETAVKSIPHILLSRFLAFCGHVAIHNFIYLKVEYFAHLRSKEAAREKRRRRSLLNSHKSSLNSSCSFMTPKMKSAKKRQSIHKTYQLVPPVDEETTFEQIIEICAACVKNEEKLIGALYCPVSAACRWSLKEFNREVQAAASISLTKFMLYSEEVCQENMQLFATITEKSPDASIRANMIIAMGDLTTTYPNIFEPWTQQIFQRLNDPDPMVRENSIIILTHLILHDFVRIKGLISDVAKCVADSNENISRVAKYLFAELSKKGNVIYNIIPDIISSLSDPNSDVEEEKFQTILRYVMQFIEKEKLVEGLVEKLCCRFIDSSNQVQIQELTFCLSILTLNDKCYSKLMEFKNLLKERMSDPVVMQYITKITANAKKNDAKTAVELEAFRKELGI